MVAGAGTVWMKKTAASTVWVQKQLQVNDAITLCLNNCQYQAGVWVPSDNSFFFFEENTFGCLPCLRLIILN
jgi:hypothetical protein